MCARCSLIISGLWFPRHKVHGYTWTSPDSTTRSQIVHLSVKKHCRRSLEDVQTYHGTDSYSKHQLVIASFKLQLKTMRKCINTIKSFDIQKLQDLSLWKVYCVNLANRFASLSTEDTTATVNKKLSLLYNACGMHFQRKHWVCKKRSGQQILETYEWPKRGQNHIGIVKEQKVGIVKGN